MNFGLVIKIFNQQPWYQAQDGIEYCSFEYKANDWNKSRRMVVVRKDSEKLSKSGGKTLFKEYDDFANYRYSVFATNSELSADLIWTIYKHRAEDENQIKELKYNYRIEGFCSEKLEEQKQPFDGPWWLII